MNTKLILLVISVAVFSSCNTLYKSGQTPDDVYYSPVRTYGEETKEEVREDRVDRYQYYNEDRAIRMGIYDARWRYLDDYRYNPYNYGFNHGYYYNPYFWPYPVYSPIFVTPTNPKVTTPRTNNLGGYGAVKGYNNVPTAPKAGRVNPARGYSNSNNNNGTAVGNAIRKVLSSGNTNTINNTNNSSSNNNNNNRTYTPANNNTRSSSSGSSSSGSSSGGGVSRPPRSGNK